MSSQNVYNSFNLPTNEALSKYFKEASMDVLKKIRFDFGCGVSKRKMKEMLRLERFVCNNICYLSEDETSLLREQVIKNSILKLDEL